MLKCDKCKPKLQTCTVCGEGLVHEDKRGCIAFVLLGAGIVLGSVVWKCSYAFYAPVTDYSADVVILRILFILGCFGVGLAGRAFEYRQAFRRGVVIYAESAPWISYFVEYGIIAGLPVSVFVFSVATIGLASLPVSSPVIFYLLSGSVGVAAGHRGYGFLEKITIPSKG